MHMLICAEYNLSSSAPESNSYNQGKQKKKKKKNSSINPIMELP